MWRKAAAKVQESDARNLSALKIVENLEVLIGREAIEAAGTENAQNLADAKNKLNRVWYYLKNREIE
jgi:hypothetical protein